MRGSMPFTGALRRPRVFYGWWIVAVGAFSAGLSSVNNLGFTVFFLPLSKELGLSRAVTSLVLSSSRLEGGMLGPFSGLAIDRLGVRFFLVFGSLVAGTGLILLGTVVHSLWSLFVVYGLVIGVGFNMGFFPTALAAINVWFIRRRTMAMGILNASWGAVGFVLVPVLSYIVLHFGWRSAAVASGVLVMASAVPAFLVVRNSPESMGLRPDGAKPDDAPASAPGSGMAERRGAAEAQPDFTVRQALKSPTFWLLVVAANLRMSAHSSLIIHFVPLLVWKGFSQQAAANVLGLWSLLIIPAGLIIGACGDLWDKRRMLMVVMLLGAAPYFLLVFGSGSAHLYLSLVLLAILDSAGVLNWSLLGDYFGRRRFATLRGIVSGVASLTVAGSPVYAGWMWDRTESYVFAMLPFGVGLLVSAAIFPLLPRPKGLAKAKQA